MNTASLVGRVGTGLSRLERPVQVSFEFFPPGDAQMEQTLWQSIQRLAPLRPRFVSVTYGADGSTRERTHNVVSRVVKETLLTPAAHLTCVGMDREHVLEIARNYWHTGVRHIVALRGDARFQRLVFLTRQPRHVLDRLELLALDDIEVAQDFFGLIADHCIDLALDALGGPGGVVHQAPDLVKKPIAGLGHLGGSPDGGAGL